MFARLTVSWNPIGNPDLNTSNASKWKTKKTKLYTEQEKNIQLLPSMGGVSFLRHQCHKTELQFSSIIGQTDT